MMVRVYISSLILLHVHSVTITCLSRRGFEAQYLAREDYKKIEYMHMPILISHNNINKINLQLVDSKNG